MADVAQLEAGLADGTRTFLFFLKFILNVLNNAYDPSRTKNVTTFKKALCCLLLLIIQSKTNSQKSFFTSI